MINLLEQLQSNLVKDLIELEAQDNVLKEKVIEEINHTYELVYDTINEIKKNG